MRPVASLVLLAAAVATAAPRWLRVAEREHYLPGAVTRFGLRWLRAGPANLAVGVLTPALAVAGTAAWPLQCAAAVGLVVWPLGLPVRGRTAPLAWTCRLRTLALVALALGAVLVATLAAVASFPLAAGVLAALVAGVVDAAALLTAPLERALAGRHVARAARRFADVHPKVVAITGSYGKTSTKEHVRDLLGARWAVVASPASFNNRAGLARTLNDHLAAGTEILIAEMGTYGPGEIRELCALVPPDVAVITAIGPVHLERMGTIDGIVRAKAEILEPAPVAVLNVDSPPLAALADELAAAPDPKRIVRCGSTGDGLDVAVTRAGGELVVRSAAGEVRVAGGTSVQPTNVACALGVALALGVEPTTLGPVIARLQSAPHRAVVQEAPSGATVIDDTFNANPDGARAALAQLRALPDAGRRVVVTPGMVELGARQADENRSFAAAAAAAADTVVVVGATNRAALLAGAREAGHAEVVTCRTRDDAVRWVRARLGAGDAVLYENDLPDHYP